MTLLRSAAASFISLEKSKGGTFSVWARPATRRRRSGEGNKNSIREGGD